MTLVDVETGVLNGIIGFLTTLSGVLIAFGLTLSYDRNKKKEEETETRNRIAKAIQLELEANLEQITVNREKQAKEQMAAFLILFPASAYQSALSGGFLSLFDSELQYNLGATYTLFKWVETVSARVLSMIGSVDMSMTGYATNMKGFQAVIDNQMARLQEIIPGLLNQVKSEESVTKEKGKRGDGGTALKR